VVFFTDSRYMPFYVDVLKFISALFKNSTTTLDKFEVSEEVKRQNWAIKFNDLGIFSYNASGFDIDLKDGFHSIKWTDIERLEAYKADLMTTDEICVNIVFDNKTIIVTEETKGWYQFIDKLQSVLPLTNSNWEDLVLKSPNEYHLITIYERSDRKMPLKTNFHSIIKGRTKEDVIYLFQKFSWTVRKSSMKDFELQNSWTDLVLESNNAELLLHGLVAYHPDNVKIIKQLFDSMECAYKFEFYNNDQIVEQTQNGT